MARVLLVAQAENPDGSLLDLIKVLEDHSYEVIKCVGVRGFLSHQMKMSTFDIILIEENLLNPTNGSQVRPQSLCETKTPVVKISYNENTIDCQYHLLKGNIVMPILELMNKHFRDGINKLKRPKEEVKHAELPAEENKKKLKRRKAGEHHERMAWIGDLEKMFEEVVKELDKNGKVTGKKVWESLQAKGFKDISMKQVNSHLQKYRDKHKNPHLVDSKSQMLGYKDQVDTSSEHDTSRHGMKEHSSNTDAPMNTINGDLNIPSQKHHLFTESLDNNIQGNSGNPKNILYDGEYDNSHLYGSCYIPSQGENFENGKEKDNIQDWNIDDDFDPNVFIMDEPSNMGSEEMPAEATQLTDEGYPMGGCQNNLSMTQGGEPSNLLVCDIQGQASDKDVPDDYPPREFSRLDSPINSQVREFGYCPRNEDYNIPSQGENTSVEQPCMGFEELQVLDCMNPNS